MCRNILEGTAPGDFGRVFFAWEHLRPGTSRAPNIAWFPPARTSLSERAASAKYGIPRSVERAFGVRKYFPGLRLCLHGYG